MKVKTSELAGAALNWAVIVAEHRRHDWNNPLHIEHFNEIRNRHVLHQQGHYSTNWSQGGPIIEREGIELLCNVTATEAERFTHAEADWQAFYRSNRSTEARQYARTPLIAAMRCYVASKLGDEVDIPEELLL